jgi:hypothetical protein
MFKSLGQTAEGRTLLRRDNGTIVEYASIGEANEAMSRLGTAVAIVQCVQSLAKAADSAADLRLEYFDVGGSYTDEELAPLGITAEQIVNCVNMLENFAKFLNNEAITVGAYRITLNQVRRMSV